MSRRVHLPPSQGRGYSVRGVMSRGRGQRSVGLLELAPALGFEFGCSAGGAGGGAASSRARRGVRRWTRRVGHQLHGRSRDAHAGHLREQSHLVMPPAGPGHRALPEVGVGGIENDAGLALRLERGGLRLSVRPVQAVDQRVHVGIDRVGGRHGEDTRAGGALLVLVQPDGGEPFVPQTPRRPCWLSFCENRYMSRLLSWPV